MDVVGVAFSAGDSFVVASVVGLLQQRARFNQT